jgi:hypothetical protein
MLYQSIWYHYSEDDVIHAPHASSVQYQVRWLNKPHFKLRHSSCISIWPSLTERNATWTQHYYVLTFSLLCLTLSASAPGPVLSLLSGWESTSILPRDSHSCSLHSQTTNQASHIHSLLSILCVDNREWDQNMQDPQRGGTINDELGRIIPQTQKEWFLWDQ